jgi:hypothetical protein
MRAKALVLENQRSGGLMFSSFGDSNRPYEVGHGDVVHACMYEECFGIADLIVRGPKRSELPICQQHWEYLNHRTRGGLIEIVRTLDRPACFRPDCHDEGVAVMENPDGSARSVCQEHLDDLSWIDLPEAVLVRRSSWPA